MPAGQPLRVAMRPTLHIRQREVGQVGLSIAPRIGRISARKQRPAEQRELNPELAGAGTGFQGEGQVPPFAAKVRVRPVIFWKPKRPRVRRLRKSLHVPAATQHPPDLQTLADLRPTIDRPAAAPQQPSAHSRPQCPNERFQAPSSGTGIRLAATAAAQPRAMGNAQSAGEIDSATLQPKARGLITSQSTTPMNKPQGQAPEPRRRGRGRHPAQAQATVVRQRSSRGRGAAPRWPFG